jgi:hypothetical protein
MARIEWSPKGDEIATDYWGDLYFINIEEVFGYTYDKLRCP